MVDTLELEEAAPGSLSLKGSAPVVSHSAYGRISGPENVCKHLQWTQNLCVVSCKWVGLGPLASHLQLGVALSTHPTLPS